MQGQRCHYSSKDSIFVCELLAGGERDVLGFAREFLDCPYVAKTLELFPDDERLIVNTSQLDCTTFVDVVVALTLCSQRGETRFIDFVHQLTMQRYWGGICQDYPSRKHYFTEWIEDNTSQQFVMEVQGCRKPFTAVQTLNVNYMTRHPEAYVSLKRHPEYLDKISKRECALTGRQYRYIPTREVCNSEEMRKAVHDGDIIAITSSKAGLDIAHLGFAVWHEDGLYFLDASSVHKRVVEEPVSLRTYLEHRKQVTGIRVIRVRNNTVHADE